MSSLEGSPERKLIVGRPLSLQPQGGSINLAFSQEDDMHNPNGSASYALYSPLSEDGYPQSPDGSIYSERSQANLIQASATGGGMGPPPRRNGNTASYSVNTQTLKDDFVMEKNASVVSHDSLNDDIQSSEFEEEKMWRVFIQMVGPFIASGLGTVAAGLLLATVLSWDNYEKIPELVSLVPVLLGLKGNLEMTLTARLCTAANMGNMDHAKELWRHVCGNMVVTQLQAVVVSFLASIISIIISIFIMGHEFNLGNVFVLCASALMTASIASMLLGCLMCAIVLLSRRFNLNPDNVSAPIAASLGDITTLALLSYISSFLYHYRHIEWLAPVIIAKFFALTPLWIVISYRNPTVRPVLITGWTPILCAMAISVGAGQLLEPATECYKLMAIYQPVIAGVGGNLVVVQTCRMTTLLGRRSQLGSHPVEDNRSFTSPISALFGHSYLSKTARLLLLVTVPGHLVFIYVIHFFQTDISTTPLFVFLYLGSAVCQVAILLYIARCLVYYMWSRAIDPDNAAIPILTAIGDLLGVGFLMASLASLHQINDESGAMFDKCASEYLSHLNVTMSEAASHYM